MVKVLSNQTVKQFEARYRNAVALVGEARAGLFPMVALNGSVTRSGGSGGGGSSSSSLGRSSGGGGTTLYSVEGSASWTPDVWSRVRRQVESNVSSAQVSAADLANAKLSAQATLATDYFDLSAEDSLTRLPRQTVGAYTRALQIVQNQYHAGTSSNIDVVTARARLESAPALFVGVGVQRAQFEHAIAVLTGHAPSELTITPAPLTNSVPVVPPGLPSALLERRSDIAGTERLMQQRNALIGVRIAAYYLDVSLSALGGFNATMLSRLFKVASRVWSLGAAGVETLYSGGARPAAVTNAWDIVALRFGVAGAHAIADRRTARSRA